MGRSFEAALSNAIDGSRDDITDVVGRDGELEPLGEGGEDAGCDGGRD